MTLRNKIKGALDSVFLTQGFHLERVGESYLGAEQTVAAAKAKGQSVREYVEELWDQKGAAERVANEFTSVGALTHCERVVEIGAGTGMFLEFVLPRVKPQQYDVYETAVDWASYLERTYAPAVKRQPADGSTLSHTPDASCGLVHAHGVCVYIKPLQSFEYFREMVRVCTPRGFIGFDYFAAERFDSQAVETWLSHPDRYPQLLPQHTVHAFFSARGYSLRHQFDHKFGCGKSQYVVYQKD